MGNSADHLDRQPAEAPPIRVFLVDDYELVRQGLTDLLGSTFPRHRLQPSRSSQSALA